MIASFSPGFVRELILSDNTIVETALFEQQRKDQAAHALTEQRNEAMREAVKGLFVMNGGGSVALLAFLQAISKEHEALAKYLVFGITPMIVGVVLQDSSTSSDTTPHGPYRLHRAESLSGLPTGGFEHCTFPLHTHPFSSLLWE